MRLVKQCRHGPVQTVQLGYSPIGPPIMSVYFYYLDGLLIDTGQSHMQQHALDAIGDLPVHHILLTHHHEDHSGNAAAFKKQSGARVVGHARTAAKLQKGYRILPYQNMIWGRAAPVCMEPISSLDPGTDRKVKWITMGNASFAHMVRSALKAAE